MAEVLQGHFRFDAAKAKLFPDFRPEEQLGFLEPA
jgi:hypothetical protein